LENSSTRNNWNRRAALITTTLSSFLGPLTLSAVNVALPAIGRDFSMDAVSLGWVATAFLFTAATLLLPFGRLADIYGRKRIFILGTWILSLSALGMGLSPGPGALILFRALQGVGGAMIFATSIAILTSVYPPEMRGRVLGINVAAVYLGQAVGPTLGGLLTYHFGWRSLFLFQAPLGLLVVFFATWKLAGEWSGERGEGFDLVGSLIYGIAFLGLTYGFSLLPTTMGGILIAFGGVGLLAFVAWEKRAKNPTLPVELFARSRALILSCAAALINYGATFAISFLLSLYLQHVKGLSPRGAGLVLVAQPLVQAVFSPLAGRISDRVEPRFVASAGMALNAFGLFLLGTVDNGTPFWQIVASLAVMGFGFAFFSSPNTNAIMGLVEARFYGVASSLVSTSRIMGQMLSMGIAMLLFNTFMGRAEIVPSVYPMLLKSTRVAFVVFGALCVLGVFASLSRGNLRQEESLIFGPPPPSTSPRPGEKGTEQ
jgi:EmrB/QacA subfamily drug resistance transporter